MECLSQTCKKGAIFWNRALQMKTRSDLVVVNNHSVDEHVSVVPDVMDVDP